jgi:ubiquinone/menaquinone biosynthesis C-methylase UbiE
MQADRLYMTPTIQSEGTMKRVDYDERQHSVYAKGRALGPAAMARWMAAFEAEAPDRRPLTVLDLGSGTGRFSPALAETFGGPVHGVEPSERMRSIATAEAAHPSVGYLAGEAAAIPLPAGSVDLVLMFLSFHHVPDRAAAAREIARVLEPDGRVFVRGTFAGRIHDLWWRRFFPRSWEIEERMFPSVEETSAVFADAGLGRAKLVQVVHPYEGDVAADVKRLRLRAISTFDHMDEAEIEAGFAQMEAALEANDIPPPAPAVLDLLVLSR